MDAPPTLLCGTDLGGWMPWTSSWRNNPGNGEIQDLQIPQLANLTIREQPKVWRLDVSQLPQITKAETDNSYTDQTDYISSLHEKNLKPILDRMKTTDRLRFRSVSRHLRSQSDSYPFPIKDLKLSFDRTGSKLDLDKRSYNFLPVMGSPDKTAHVTVALQRLLTLLKIRNLQLENLVIELLEFDKEGWQEASKNVILELTHFREAFPNRIHVKKFDMRWSNPVLLEEFLPVFEPQTLEHIKYDTCQRVWSCFGNHPYPNDMIFFGLPEISDMRQWREAKTVELFAGVSQIMAKENINALDFFNEIHLYFDKNYSQAPELLRFLITNVNRQQTLKMDKVGWLRFQNFCRFLESEVVIVENQHQAQFRDEFQTYQLCYTRHENSADTGILIVKNLNV